MRTAGWCLVVACKLVTINVIRASLTIGESYPLPESTKRRRYSNSAKHHRRLFVIYGMWYAPFIKRGPWLSCIRDRHVSQRFWHNKVKLDLYSIQKSCTYMQTKVTTVVCNLDVYDDRNHRSSYVYLAHSIWHSYTLSATLYNRRYKLLWSLYSDIPSWYISFYSLIIAGSSCSIITRFAIRHHMLDKLISILVSLIRVITVPRWRNYAL